MTRALRVALLALGPIVFAATSPMARAATPPAGAAAGAVSVTVRYTGQGTVDDGHRLWIWLFDSPDIGPGSIPIHEASVAANGATTTIEVVGPDRVWIAVAYDQRGGSAGNAPPASGSPVGIHADADGRPTQVDTRGAATAVVTFDDSVRMP
jgi:hypothetical protein